MCSCACFWYQAHSTVLELTVIDACRDMVAKYGIKYFYDITDRADFRANPDYKGVCHIAMAQEGHCLPGWSPISISPHFNRQPLSLSGYIAAVLPYVLSILTASSIWRSQNINMIQVVAHIHLGVFVMSLIASFQGLPSAMHAAQSAGASWLQLHILHALHRGWLD